MVNFLNNLIEIDWGLGLNWGIDLNGLCSLDWRIGVLKLKFYSFHKKTKT